MRESTEGVSVGVLEVAVLGVVGAGPTTALRLGAWVLGVGCWGLGVGCWADDGDVRGSGLLGDAAAWRAVMLGLWRQVQLREVQRHRG